MNSMYTKLISRYDRFTREHGLSGSVLKIIAIITMLIDHTAFYFLEGTAVYWPMRIIGRISFILFAFLVAEGIKHTSDILKYALRILIFAIICQIPYNLFDFGTIFVLKFKNIFFSFFFAILPFIPYKKIDGTNGKVIAAALGIISVIAAYFLQFEYNFFGLGIIWLFAFSNKKNIIPILVLLSVLCIFYHRNSFQVYELLAFPIIFFYNGERGFIRSKVAKYAFYLIYPLQFLIIWIIGQIIT